MDFGLAKMVSDTLADKTSVKNDLNLIVQGLQTIPTQSKVLVNS